MFIEARGRYSLTPLYDVISAYPLAAKRQIEWKDLKMAMAVVGKNRHYHWHTIQLRHWLSTAELCHFPKQMMQSIIDEVCDNLDNVIDKVTGTLPKSFPKKISDSIFNGMRKVKNKL